MNTRPLAIPRTSINATVPPSLGVVRPSTSNVRKTPIAPNGISPYSTRDGESRPTRTAPTPIPTDSIVRGRPAMVSDKPSTALA